MSPAATSTAWVPATAEGNAGRLGKVIGRVTGNGPPELMLEPSFRMGSLENSRPTLAPFMQLGAIADGVTEDRTRRALADHQNAVGIGHRGVAPEHQRAAAELDLRAGDDGVRSKIVRRSLCEGGSGRRQRREESQRR